MANLMQNMLVNVLVKKIKHELNFYYICGTKFWLWK